MEKTLGKEKTVGLVMEHKTYGYLVRYIERRNGVPPDTRKLAFLKMWAKLLVDKNYIYGTLRLNGRVLPGQKYFGQLNATDFEVHNIAPSPQLCGWHTRQ